MLPYFTFQRCMVIILLMISVEIRLFVYIFGPHLVFVNVLTKYD